jgi:DnaJ-class molecular chaperone
MITDAMVDAAVKAHEGAIGALTTCPRCEGRGYHHGFGEHGHDPDWCEDCGGPGVAPLHTAESAMRLALEAAEQVQHSSAMSESK